MTGTTLIAQTGHRSPVTGSTSMTSRLLAPAFAFRAIPTTLLTLITYLSVFIALVITDVLPDVPKNQGGLNIQEAYEDLRQVCLPFCTHGNKP
jgi:hypothetical protein